MEISVVSPNHDEGKQNRLLEGPIQAFPGNASMMQFFQSGFNSVIDSNAIALLEEETRHTFKELDETSSKIAKTLRELLELSKNSNPDQDFVIGVCLPPSDKLILTLFAILKLGASYLPFEVSFPEERVVKIVKDSKPVMIISDNHSNVLSKFDSVKDTTKVISSSELFNLAQEKTLTETELKNPETFPGILPLAERTAIVLYTSGSSGEPKGVRLSHRAVLNRLNWQWKTFPFIQNEKCVFKTSLTFVDSVAEIFGPLLQGHSITVLSKQVTSTTNLFIQKLYQHGITRLVLVPSLLKAIFHTMKIIGDEEGRKMLDSVKLWICSGETLTKELLNEFFERFNGGFTICNFYGSTEVMADVSYVSFSTKMEVYQKTLENHVPLGQSIYNTVIYVLSPDMEMCQVNQMGEIYIGGYNLAKGYVGMEDHPSFISNPFSKSTGFNRLYRTGDFGRITETQGKIRTLAYEGRIDSQIKVRGQRVDLSEIEMTICGINLIAKAKVLCYHAGQEDQSIVAFVVPESDDHMDRIKTLVETRLRDYERPVLRILKDIPLLVNGKTDRQQLLQIYEKELENRTNFVDWSSLEVSDAKLQVAKAVLTAISEATGTSIETIAENLDNSFYNVGGSSLNSILVIVKLREKNFQISIQDFTHAKSIKHIIHYTNYTTNEEEAEEWSVSKEAAAKYSAALLTFDDKEDTSHIIAHSFSHHGDLEAYTDATYDEFRRLIKSIWKDLVEKGFSFIIRRLKDNKAIGVALNFDVYDEPSSVEASKGIAYVLEMLEFLESRQREKLPKGKGKLIHSFMMGTSEEIDESENVFVIEYMEEEVMRMAREKNYYGIMTTNTNPLTQQIGLSLHGYESLSEYQVNRYVAPDGTKPFVLAPDSFKIICCWKKVGQHQLDAEKELF